MSGFPAAGRWMSGFPWQDVGCLASPGRTLDVWLPLQGYPFSISNRGLFAVCKR